MFIFPVLMIKILTKSGECNQYCPATCGENEMVCSSYDPTTSCPHPDSCMPATFGRFIQKIKILVLYHFAGVNGIFKYLQFLFLSSLKFLKYLYASLENLNYIRSGWYSMYYNLSCHMWSRGTDV